MELKEIRKRIDLLDSELLTLLNRRMELALRTKKMKEHVTDAAREDEVLSAVKRHPHSLLGPEFSERVYREIIAESKKLQARNLRLIGFQGEHGAYSEVAARGYDAEAVPMPHAEFSDVFSGVKKGQLDTGIVPVENTLGGAVAQVNDLLVETDLKVVAEVMTPIHHCLLALPDSDYRDIRVVYSHPQALSQCRGFIARNKLEGRPFYDTAGAAMMLARERPAASAAIASDLCAELYDLEILKENIEDEAANSTRFLVLAREPSAQKGDKCSIVFSTAHKPGALFRILKAFSEADINLTRIESRPVAKDPGRYAFLLDFQGWDGDGRVADTLEKVKKDTAMYRFLGCYAEAAK